MEEADQPHEHQRFVFLYLHFVFNFLLLTFFFFSVTVSFVIMHITLRFNTLVDMLNYSPNITFKEASATVFYYSGLFDEFYDMFPPSKIQQNHIFWVENDNPPR